MATNECMLKILSNDLITRDRLKYYSGTSVILYSVYQIRKLKSQIEKSNIELCNNKYRILGIKERHTGH